MLDLKSRIKNVGFWVTLFSAIGLIIQLFYPIFDLGKFDIITKALLSFLTVAGVFNNPTTQTNTLLDDKVNIIEP